MTKMDYGDGCQNSGCQSNELCVGRENASHTCYPLDSFGFSSKPNGCTSISCESWGWKYQECPVDNLGAGRVVSMTIISQRYYCNFGLDKVYYGWKRNMIYVNNGCRATFDVCYTVY
ncbi:lectin ADEL-like [Mytilus trossulus]|uniref:lectin ADEL-like n=1 Tax=Mytilus trossulus TaxID=6551 RepID=UPI003005FE80